MKFEIINFAFGLRENGIIKPSDMSSRVPYLVYHESVQYYPLTLNKIFVYVIPDMKKITTVDRSILFC